jgi:hypothetical protein
VDLLMIDTARTLTKLLRLRPYEVELLRSERRVAPVSWLLLASGMIALAGAALAARPGWEQHRDLEQQRAAADAALERLGADSGRAGSAAHSRAPAGAKSDLEDAGAIVAELHRPWHAFFDQLEAADEAAVHVQQLSVGSRFASVQLVAEGRELDRLVRYSQRLPGAGPIRSMTITHHEWRDAMGTRVVSASLQGELSVPDPKTAGGSQ